MKNFRLSLISVFLCFGFASSNTWAADEYDFSDITKAFQTFLNKDLAQISGEVEDKLGDFWHLSSFAANRVIKDPNNSFKIIHACNYNMLGKEIPVIIEPFVTDNFDHTVDLFINGYYFITHFYADNIKTENLIVKVSRDNIQVYGLINNLSLTLDFIAKFRDYEINKNPYRNGVLEMKDYPEYPMRSVFSFMGNMSTLTSTWQDLILEKSLKAISFDQTEGFLGRLSFYKALDINMKKGILLAGPPGTGKSMLGEILVQSILHGDLKDKSTLVIISARHLQDPARIRLLYSGARKLAPTAIFMEDIDLFGVKNRENEVGDFDAETRLNELLNGIDGLIDANHILTIGTTNRIDYVDPALTRSMRLGQHLWYGLPSFEERREFFNRFGVKMAVWDPLVTDLWLASQTEGMSGADIIEIIRLAKKEAYLGGSWAEEKLLLNQTHFLNAISLLKDDHSGTGNLMRSGSVLGKYQYSYSFVLRRLNDLNSSILRRKLMQ